MERTLIFLNLTEGLRVNKVGIWLSADTDYNEQRSAAAGQKL
jgi:hypothetical protein